MDVRASDAERDGCVEQLRTAAAEGRLTFEELADRIDVASCAVMRGELVALTSDLPGTPTALAQAPPASMLRTAGDIKRSGPLVPEGVEIDLRARASIGKIKHEVGKPSAYGAPRIVITGGTAFGDVKVRHQRRWEKLFRKR